VALVAPTLSSGRGQPRADGRSVSTYRSGARTIGHGGQNGASSALSGRISGLAASDDHFVDED
jgi:hypothetical protein